MTEQEMEQLTQLVQGAVNTTETAAEDFQNSMAKGWPPRLAKAKKPGLLLPEWLDLVNWTGF